MLIQPNLVQIIPTYREFNASHLEFFWKGNLWVKKIKSSPQDIFQLIFSFWIK